MNKNKTSIAITLFLIFAMTISIVAMPSVIADEPPTKSTFAIIGATPNPVGVGQEVLIALGITHATFEPQLGWVGITVTVERPDGKTETLGPFDTDTVGTTGTIYVPNMEGIYYFQTHFPEQELTVLSHGTPPGTIMKASTSEKLALNVTAEQRQYYPGMPLPNEYWTRPIHGELREWSTISGNWLGGFPQYAQDIFFAPYNEDAPEAAHILWAKPIAIGGLSGGELGPHSYSCGKAYENLFEPAIIIGGVLYYNPYQPSGGINVEQIVVAVDLKTGEELWARPLQGPDGVGRRLSFGQVMYWSSHNWHGAFAYLWAVVGSTWHAFEPATGRWVYSMTNVPSSTTNTYGPNGELLRYTVNLRQGWMTLWNSTRAGNPQDGSVGERPHRDAGSWSRHLYGTTVDARRGIEWNVTIPTGLPGAVKIVLEDRIIGSNTEFVGGAAQPNPVFWGISTAPGNEGRLLFNSTWQLPIKDLHVDIPGSGAQNSAASLEDGVFILATKDIPQYYGFSLDTGKQLWGPTEPQPYQAAWDIIYRPFLAARAIGYGKLFTAGYCGEVNAYDIKTGEHLWRFEAKDKYTEILWGDNWPVHISFIAAGKIYLQHEQHSPMDPKERGAPFICLDVETGEEIFWMSGFFVGRPFIIGDSTIVGLNSFDNRVYAFGKGPSATTVTAPDIGVPFGKSVIVRGTVTDVSPGTKDAALQMRFPNGVPAVADVSMSEWMNYVHMQFPRPKDIVGVEVVVSVLDPNNNYYEVGRTTANENGFFRLSFEPLVPGDYTVIATFEGSKSYYGSFAETAISVEEAPPSAPDTTPPPASVADVYFVPAVAGIIVAIAIVGALVLLALRKR